jgi:hypothetical protein
MFDSPMAWITGTQNTEDPRDFMKASFNRRRRSEVRSVRSA